MNTVEIRAGTRWRNRHTKQEDTILQVGPCSNLHGATRVWFTNDEARWPSNGWNPSDVLRCWYLVSDDQTSADAQDGAL